MLAEPLGGPTRPFTHRRSFFSTFGRQSHYFGWAVVLLVLLPIQDTRPEAAEAVYDHLWKLFVRGQLIECQQRASTNYESFRISNPNLAVQLRLLEAEAMLWRGFSSDALGVLSQMSAPADKDAVVKKLALEGAALTRMERFSEADQKLVQAENLCRSEFHRTCGDVPRARGVLEMGLGQQARGQQLFLESLAFARYHRDPFLEASALVNLGFAALQSDHFDEAADWSRDANRVASELGADYVAEVTEGNLAWSYYALGDHDQALALFLDAEKRSINLGSVRDQIRWLENIGYVYESNGDLAHAAPIYHSALDLARKIDSKADIVITLEYLAFASVDAGKLEEADFYLEELSPLIQAESDHGDQLWAELARGRIAALRHQDQQARPLLRDVWRDSESETSIKLEAGRQLARLDEAQGRAADADKDYKATLATFEQARNELKKEDSRLPFLANATAIYDDYIHFLVQQGKPLQALAVADQSRARTLEEGLGIAAKASSLRMKVFDPRSVAARTQATLLFYWLGEKQSYLWAITPAKATLFNLPPRPQIAAHVESYRKTLLDLRDPLEAKNADGQALYQMLVAPAYAMIEPTKPAIILDEGVLSKLNFETLLVPGAGAIGKQTAGSTAQLHYLIDDLTLSSAPSLAMLAATKPALDAEPRMLLLGDPVSPDREFPSLPLFAFEVSQVGSHFSSKQVITGQQATPAAYAASKPEQFSYIHFVSHAVASSTDPLDSAIILSNSAASEDSFKLYAREIIQHPIRAKLVTISACYGSGTRAYAGEGLVGLSWAFLRAGADQVIGALWEVSDDSTPRMMNALYQGLSDGQSPASALHNAKLALLHSPTRFRLPFYWAPFQIYGRQ